MQVVYKMTNNFCIQAAGLNTQCPTYIPSLDGSDLLTNCSNLPLEDILVLKNMYNCCYEIRFKSYMYIYILYEWCVFNW